jgi:hypothetical protein
MLGLAAGFGCDCGNEGLAGLTLGAMLGGLGTGLGALIGMAGRVDDWAPVMTPPGHAGMMMRPAGIALLHFEF